LTTGMRFRRVQTASAPRCGNTCAGTQPCSVSIGPTQVGKIWRTQLLFLGPSSSVPVFPGKARHHHAYGGRSLPARRGAVRFLHGPSACSLELNCLPMRARQARFGALSPSAHGCAIAERNNRFPTETWCLRPAFASKRLAALGRENKRMYVSSRCAAAGPVLRLAPVTSNSSGIHGSVVALIASRSSD